MVSIIEIRQFILHQNLTMSNVNEYTIHTEMYTNSDKYKGWLNIERLVIRNLCAEYSFQIRI